MTTDRQQTAHPKCALFDFDGVVADTEPIYDQYWSDAARRYGLRVENFTKLIKGTTLPLIFERFFADRTEDFHRQVKEELDRFEETMPFPPMPGSVEFIRMLKERGVRTGLVTSSGREKMRRALSQLELENTFDTIVTFERVTQGKPNPECYLLGASDLGVSPEDCVVFEDSLNGIAAGNAAGMRVIGLSTTNPAELLQDKVYKILPDLRGVTFEEYKTW